MPRTRKTAATAARKAPRQVRSRETVACILDATARILKRNGYAGTNTNLVAAAAGVSVGSLYQYFPNKQALVAALHERHARELAAVLAEGFARAPQRTLEGAVRALVRAALAAHLVDPALHRVLEGEVPDLDRFAGAEEMDRAILARVRDTLAAHRTRVAPADLDLAALVVMRIVEALVHAAVIDPVAASSAQAIEREIQRAVLGYLAREP